MIVPTPGTVVAVTGVFASSEGTIMGQRRLVVVCAWCNRVMSTAPAGSDVTHTICESCLDYTMNMGGDGAGPPADDGLYRLPDRYFGLDEL
jgi:hypothetical protein